MAKVTITIEDSKDGGKPSVNVRFSPAINPASNDTTPALDLAWLMLSKGEVVRDISTEPQEQHERRN